MITDISKIKEKLYDVKYDRIEQGKVLALKRLTNF